MNEWGKKLFSSVSCRNLLRPGLLLIDSQKESTGEPSAEAAGPRSHAHTPSPQGRIEG